MCQSAWKTVSKTSFSCIGERPPWFVLADWSSDDSYYGWGVKFALQSTGLFFGASKCIIPWSICSNYSLQMVGVVTVHAFLVFKQFPSCPISYGFSWKMDVYISNRIVTFGIYPTIFHWTTTHGTKSSSSRIHIGWAHRPTKVVTVSWAMAWFLTSASPSKRWRTWQICRQLDTLKRRHSERLGHELCWVCIISSRYIYTESAIFLQPWVEHSSFLSSVGCWTPSDVQSLVAPLWDKGQTTIGPREDVNVPNVGETQNHPTLKHASQKSFRKTPKKTNNQPTTTNNSSSQQIFLVNNEIFKAFDNIDMKHSAAHMSRVIGLSYNPSY